MEFSTPLSQRQTQWIYFAMAVNEQLGNLSGLAWKGFVSCSCMPAVVSITLYRPVFHVLVHPSSSYGNFISTHALWSLQKRKEPALEIQSSTDKHSGRNWHNLYLNTFHWPSQITWPECTSRVQRRTISLQPRKRSLEIGEQHWCLRTSEIFTVSWKLKKWYCWTKL